MQEVFSFIQTPFFVQQNHKSVNTCVLYGYFMSWFKVEFSKEHSL